MFYQRCLLFVEYQQKELQSNLSLLHPKEADLAEIRWQEKEIIRLLNEQQLHQQKYEKLHRLQQEQLEKQAMKFQQERQVYFLYSFECFVTMYKMLMSRFSLGSREATRSTSSKNERTRRNKQKAGN